MEEIFELQLKKLGVDYFDFYLFHNVCEMSIDAYLDDEKYGIYSYLMKQKQNGRIRHLVIALYNEHAYTGGGFIAPMALSALPEEKQPQSCIGCRSCEQVCPQQIKISEVMADFTAKLG